MTCRPLRRRALAALAALCLMATSCGGDDDAGPTSEPQVPEQAPQTGGGPSTSGSTGQDPGLDEPAPVAGVTAARLEAPIALVVRPGDDHLWVAERAGTVRRLAVSDDGRTLEPVDGPVLDISDQTTIDGERGLLGLAFSPDGSTLYVSHTDAAGDTRLAAYALDGDTVDAASREVLLAVDQPYANHNGGHVVLGPDGLLWFGLGDGGAADDPANRAQDPDDPLGKILRLDPVTGQSEAVVSGVRNPWRFAFDADGSLWVADVGQNTTEEIDHLPAGSIDGSNLGWSGYEGSEPYLDGDGRRPADPVMPVFEYGRDGGNCSITGGFPYRGEALAGLEGAFLFADLCAGRVRAVRLDDAGRLAAEYDLEVDVEQPISFGADAAGEPYVLSASGDVVRLVPA